MPRDYYDILGVPKNASQDDLKKAFRKLARTYHPDVNNVADAEDTFKEINEAYQVLSDDNRRAAYDRLGHQGYHESDASSSGEENLSHSRDPLGGYARMFAAAMGYNQTGSGTSSPSYTPTEMPYSTNSPASNGRPKSIQLGVNDMMFVASMSKILSDKYKEEEGVFMIPKSPHEDRSWMPDFVWKVERYVDDGRMHTRVSRTVYDWAMFNSTEREIGHTDFKIGKLGRFSLPLSDKYQIYDARDAYFEIGDDMFGGKSTHPIMQTPKSLPGHVENLIRLAELSITKEEPEAELIREINDFGRNNIRTAREGLRTDHELLAQYSPAISSFGTELSDMYKDSGIRVKLHPRIGKPEGHSGSPEAGG